jgi:hypothetical protein
VDLVEFDVTDDVGIDDVDVSVDVGGLLNVDESVWCWWIG